MCCPVAKPGDTGPNPVTPLISLDSSVNSGTGLAL
jgi:hypothetical protein